MFIRAKLRFCITKQHGEFDRQTNWLKTLPRAIYFGANILLRRVNVAMADSGNSMKRAAPGGAGGQQSKKRKVGGHPSLNTRNGMLMHQYISESMEAEPV